ncbi:MAG: hypothetical protein U1E47_06770 [Rivihabitans pingtungensis]
MPLAAHHIAHGDEQRLAVRVADLADVLAVEFGFDRVLHHVRVHVEDIKILFVGVAQFTDGAARLRLRTGQRQTAVAHQPVVVVQYANGHLHHVLQGRTTVFQHALIFGVQGQRADQSHAGQGGQQQDIELAAHTESVEHLDVSLYARRHGPGDGASIGRLLSGPARWGRPDVLARFLSVCG